MVYCHIGTTTRLTEALSSQAISYRPSLSLWCPA
uniref:Uncharacterized protein n=1 Tax=Podoviridae sp. ctz6O13 TaxID=2827757 RepID=A0A8S5TKK3_9CAUD|nr:MAG TPA: hypothetical protein [Podoviridae sp. ctz6O13]